jgi:hypothetical protein
MSDVASVFRPGCERGGVGAGAGGGGGDGGEDRAGAKKRRSGRGKDTETRKSGYSGYSASGGRFSKLEIVSCFS